MYKVLGSFTSNTSKRAFWFAKTECNDVATWWEYLYSHNEQPISILDASNDNVNMYMGCDNGMGGGGNQMGGGAAVWTSGEDLGVSGSFIRTVMIDGAGTVGLIDLNLHDFGEHGTITDRWNHVVLRVSTTTMSHVVDGTATTDASYAVFYHHDYANSGASTFWPSPTTSLATAFTSFSLADTAIIGAVDNGDADFQGERHFHGDFVGLLIYGDTLSDAEAACLFTVTQAMVPDSGTPGGGGGGGGDTGGTNCVGDVCGTVTEVGSSDAGTTYQIGVTLSGSATNVYTIYGTDTSPLSVPASYQEAAPFGSNTGGVSPAFVAVIATAAYDGWLTVGITEGDAAGALGSVGLDWDTWTADAALESANGAVFFMNPDDGPAEAAVLAQFTTAPGWSATLGAQGRSSSGDDWQADGLSFSA